MKHAWLRHPARTITRAKTCPTGKHRFTSVAVAQEALPILLDLKLAATACTLCSGAHHEPLPPVTPTWRAK